MREDLPILNLSNPLHRKVLMEYIKTRKGNHRVEITRCKDQRSLQQNSYLWGVVYPTILPALIESSGEEINTLDVHEFFKAKFLRRAIVAKNSGEIIGCTIARSRDLDVAEFSKFLQQVIDFAYDSLGVNVPPARDYENEPEKVKA